MSELCTAPLRLLALLITVQRLAVTNQLNITEPISFRRMFHKPNFSSGLITRCSTSKLESLHNVRRAFVWPSKIILSEWWLFFSQKIALLTERGTTYQKDVILATCKHVEWLKSFVEYPVCVCESKNRHVNTHSGFWPCLGHVADTSHNKIQSVTTLRR